jgi:1A family penicillin-binding protein
VVSVSVLKGFSADWKRLCLHWRFAPVQPARTWLRKEWRLAVFTIAAVASLATFDAWLLTCGFTGCPSPKEIRAYRPAEGGKVLDRNGKLIGRLQTVKRANVELRQVPKHVRQAFVATEDRRFYEHRGLDWRALGRAAMRNVTSLGVREGFSTITMQVARNTFIARRSAIERSLGRKLLELRYARLIEHALSKDQILELYLNAIYLGNGVYGVEAASRDLFGKRIRDISLAEGAMLAALPKGPSSYTPRRDRSRALARRNLVLGLMRRERYIDTRAYNRAHSERLTIARTSWRPVVPDESYAVGIARMVVDSVLRSLGESATTGGDLVVYTTIDFTAQRVAERVIRRHAESIDRDEGGWEHDAKEGDRVEGALVAIDPRTGDLRAVVGGRRYERGTFNRAFSARRQPGSAFKPFVYAAALGAGFSPATIVDDDPVSIDNGGRVWTPANFDDEYAGRVTLRDALLHSRNAATVRVSRAVGEERVVQLAHANGIGSPLPAVPALALGAVEVTPLELAAAYAPFANGGLRVEPRLVRRIERASGGVLWTDEILRTAVMDPRDAFQLTSMLRSVVDGGTGHALREMGVEGQVAGKTGTTNDGTDVWFVGYSPTLVASVWFGFDRPKSLGWGATGGRLAAPAWAEFYLQGWRDRAGRDAWSAPEGLISREIDAETGELAGEWCPRRQREWFKPGTEPTEYCTGHDEPTFDDHWVQRVDRDHLRRLSRALRRFLRIE